jgi:PelA/Pel-15E family pectate lyase
MKLYDSCEKFCHCALKSSLANEMTITFSIKFKECLDRDYVLICKEGEFLVKLSKKNKIYFYVADNCGNMKIQAKTETLPSCEYLEIAIVRDVECKRTTIFVNCVVNVSDCIDEEFLTISKACGELNCYYGGDCADYEMKKVVVYNEVLSFDELKGFSCCGDLPCCSNKDLLEQIFCKMYETYRFEDNIYYYIMTPHGLVFYPRNTNDGESGNNYPEFAFRYYNIEQNERNLPIDGLKCVSYEELCTLFDVDKFITNLVTWQFLDAANEFQIAHPKDIASGSVGYWSPGLGVNPFTPWLGNQVQSAAGEQTNVSNLRNGMVISFVKLLMDRYVCVKSEIYRKSLDKLVDYLIALLTIDYGVTDVFPLTTTPKTGNDALVSLRQGNFLNYLKILDCILDHPNLRNMVDDTRIEKLTMNRDNALTRLLALQVECGGKLTIWAEFYDADATDGTDYTANTIVDENPSTLPLLTVPESAEILTYLMNLKCPTSVIKKAIKAGVEWLKLSKMEKWVQYFDETSQTMIMAQNNYVTVPEQDLLHSHYYILGGSFTADAVIPDCGAIFMDMTPATTGVYSTDSTVFPDNFNFATNSNQTFDVQKDQFGTWANCAINLYNEWKLVHDSPCAPMSCSKCKTSCKHSCKRC